MQDVQTYDQRSFLSDLRWQAVSFMRMEWPFIDGGLFRETYPASVAPMHFALAEDGILLSYAAVLRLDIVHDGEQYAMAGLGNVLTFPSHRHRGLGSQVVAAATRWIDAGSADVAALFCDHGLAGFYAACGWQRIDNAATVIGMDGSAHHHEALCMMRFVSARGKAGEHAFRHRSLRVPFTW